MVKNLPAKQETQKTWVRSLGLKISWRRKWQLTPIFLLEKSHGHRSLEASHGVAELDTTEYARTMNNLCVEANSHSFQKVSFRIN